MKFDVLRRTTLGKAWLSVTMASSERLLGPQLPLAPSHLAVRSPHNAANESCCSLEPPFTPLVTRGITSSLQQGEHFQVPPDALPTAPSLDAHQPDKPTEKPPIEEVDVVVDVAEVGAGQSSSSSSTTGCYSSGFGLRSKLTSMLSLEKRANLHSSHNVMMERAGFSTRRAPLADSTLCAAVQKESFTRMYDLYDDARCYGAHGSVGRSACGEDNATGVTSSVDTAWMDQDKPGNDAWGTEPWHFDQRSILMKTLHIMRCDIESLKMMLRSLDLPAARGGPLDPHLRESTLGYMPYTQHPVMRRTGNSAMAEVQQPAEEQAVGDSLVKGDKESLAQAAEKEPESADKEQQLLEVPPPEKQEEEHPEPEESISTATHGCTKKRRQWWRELLAAFGLTVWVITGAVLVAKAIGVPNLGVSNNVAYNGFWGRSDDDEKTASEGPKGVLELGDYSFNDTVKKSVQTNICDVLCAMVSSLPTATPHMDRPCWCIEQERIQCSASNSGRHEVFQTRRQVRGARVSHIDLLQGWEAGGKAPRSTRPGHPRVFHQQQYVIGDFPLETNSRGMRWSRWLASYDLPHTQ